MSDTKLSTCVINLCAFCSPSSVRQQREMISSLYFEERERRRPIFRIFIWNLTLALHGMLEPFVRMVGVLNRSRNLRNSKFLGVAAVIASILILDARGRFAHSFPDYIIGRTSLPVYGKLALR